MSTENSAIPFWFWVIAVLALLWNGMGVLAYIADVSQTAEDLAKMPQIQQEMVASRPAWVLAAFAIAVFAGFLGAICLLLRRKLASTLFLASLIAVLIQNFWVFGVAKMHEVSGNSAMAMPIMVTVIALVLLFFARSSTARGWLK